MEPGSPALQADSLPSEPPGEPHVDTTMCEQTAGAEPLCHTGAQPGPAMTWGAGAGGQEGGVYV